ncbi:MAG TPA: hypothetical protein VEW71_01385 [Allosphingosinicella sp.]|nr:hypothetical protein [Allosphingosinicella sp.]
MKKFAIALASAALAAVPAASMQSQPPSQSARQPQTERGTVIFYDQTNYNGRSNEIDSATRIFHWDYNIRSIAIHPGDRWQICARRRFDGCIVLDRSVPDATMVGITASIGSVRPAPEGAARQDNQ